MIVKADGAVTDMAREYAQSGAVIDDLSTRIEWLLVSAYRAGYFQAEKEIKEEALAIVAIGKQQKGEK